MGNEASGPAGDAAGMGAGADAARPDAISDHNLLGRQRARRTGGGLADLEDGPLRRELGFAASVPYEAPPPAYSAALRFTGTGAEYFRIWVVHLFLTLVTLGVYSAWAKVRKARWFAQHTELMGDRFDFHGDPKRILLGRLLAIILVVLWTQSFKLSTTFGLVMFALLCALGPWLFAGAQRFKLANTSWRGLRFGFHVPWPKVYAVCVPLLLLWTAGTVLAALEAPAAWQAGAGVLLLLGLPWAHALLKQLQHGHARFGVQGFGFDPAKLAFYGLYGKAMVLAIVAGMLLALLGGVLVAANKGSATAPGAPGSVWVMLSGVLLAALVWLSAWPYFAARTQQIVWGHTHWGGVRFAGQMRAWPLWKLAAGQSLLVLLSCGLYWPFAVVNIARYRVQALVLTAGGPIADVVAQGPPTGDPRASGDAAAEFFGLDLGW